MANLHTARNGLVYAQTHDYSNRLLERVTPQLATSQARNTPIRKLDLAKLTTSLAGDPGQQGI